MSVAFLPSAGFRGVLSGCAPSGAAGSGGDAGGDAAAPRWDGCDRWALDPRYRVLAASALAGYVRDSVLYVEPTTTRRLPLQLGVAVAELSTPGVIAPLERLRADGSPAGDEPADLVRIRGGIVFGRATAREALDLFGRYRELPEEPCLPKAAFDTIRGLVCGSEDLPSSPEGLGQPCDALSFALRFDAVPAIRGDVEDSASAAELCVDAGAAPPADYFECPR